MLHPEERAEKVIAGVPYPGSHTGIRQPITTGIRDWRRDLQPRDVELIEALVGNTITRAGYERRFDPTPLRARARARWQRVSLGVRKAKHDIPKSARLRIARLRGRKV
jgi:hypothetical protein